MSEADPTEGTNQIKWKTHENLDPDVIGEWTIEDIDLFHSTGPLSQVWLMWESIKQFARLVDNAHARQILSLNGILDKFGKNKQLAEHELDALFMANDLYSRTTLSSKVLVKATVLELLSGFAEFTVKELVKLVEPGKPLSRVTWEDLVKILKTKGIFTGYPKKYVDHVQNHRDSVRNNFAHGNWEQLSVEVESVDLDEALWGTAEFVLSMQECVEKQFPDLAKPTITLIKAEESNPKTE